MLPFDAAHALAIDVMTVKNEGALADLLHEVCACLGCDFFALSHHVDFLAHPQRGVRIHNYPEEWARWFDEQGLGLTDPIHRASQRTSAPFLWNHAPLWAPPRPEDERVRAEARRHGLADGLTMPAHLPGDAHGSVSFAWREGGPDLGDLPLAGMIGPFAFEAARQIAGPVPEANRPRLTDRQRDCILWIARGKSDWVTSKLLNLSQDTVAEHVKNARARYDAPTRMALLIRALWDGTITFGEIASWR